MYRGTTPTFTMTLPEEIDLSNADNVYVTFSGKDSVLLTKGTEDLQIKRNVVKVTLTQSETIGFPSRVMLQINWTYTDGNTQKRACSNIKTVEFKTNLIEKELS